MSTAGADARLHTDTTWTGTDRGVPIYWVNGARVADDYQDFYDGAWADEANPMNGFGEPRSLAATAPWTGTGHDGTELFEGGVSRAMGQASVGVGALDSAVPGAGPLNGGAAFASTEERPLYALWHVMVIDENFRLAGNLNSAFNPTRDSDERAAVRAQLFTTGSHPGGYGISEIVVRRGSADPADASWATSPSIPRTRKATRTWRTGSTPRSAWRAPIRVIWYLEAPEGTVLEASTTYALVFEGKAGAYPKLATSSADGEDAVAEGWSIADVLRYHDGSNWVDNPDGYALTMDIKGPLAAVTTEVPNNWSLKPTGLNTGDRFRLLFLSSTKRDGTATDIATYNTFIQNLAAAGHTDIRDYSAGFRVVGCTAAVDARDNTATTYTTSDKGVPIYWLNGAKAADEYEDFYDGSWDDEANDKNESGTDAHETSIQSNFPSTGCNHDGTEAFQAGDSIALGGSDVRLGRPNSTTAGHGPISSDRHRRTDVTFTNPLYGLSALFRVAADTTAPELTSATVSESGGNIALVFSEDLHSTNLPLATAFTVTAGGTAVTVSAVALGTTPDALQITVSPVIGQGQAVVVDYDDPTSGNDANAIQDTAGNDTPDFTTGAGGVPAVTNNSTVANAVLAGWSLTPTGLAAGDQFRLLFLSSTKRDACPPTSRTTTPSSRPAPRPATPTSGTTARASGWSAALPPSTPATTPPPRSPRKTRACPSTGSTAPRPPTSTRISTTGTGTTRPTTRTSPAPTAPTPPRYPTSPSPAARTRAPRSSPSSTYRRRSARPNSIRPSAGPTPPVAATAPSAAPARPAHSPAPCTGSRRSSRWPMPRTPPRPR